LFYLLHPRFDIFCVRSSRDLGSFESNARDLSDDRGYRVVVVVVLVRLNLNLDPLTAEGAAPKKAMCSENLAD
jgi:hypothetical protein